MYSSLENDQLHVKLSYFYEITKYGLLPMINTRNILEFLAEPFHILLRNPQKFRCEIKKNPTMQMKLSIPSQVADSNEIVHWDTWGNRGLNHKFSLRWWNKSQSFKQYVPEIQRITLKETFLNWNCDIQEISGLNASKSDLKKFKNLDEFAISTTLISEINDHGLQKNLLWENGKILNYPYLNRYAWDNNRIHLSNSGGSHHFAAARYIASKLSKKVTIIGKLESFKLLPEPIISLLNQYDLYAVSHDHEVFINDQSINFGATVGFFDAPSPFRDKVIVFFPRNNKRSMCLSKLFKQLNIFDFSKFLLESLNKQQTTHKPIYENSVIQNPLTKSVFSLMNH